MWELSWSSVKCSWKHAVCWTEVKGGFASALLAPAHPWVFLLAVLVLYVLLSGNGVGELCVTMGDL